jgi:hypothetical protein
MTFVTSIVFKIWEKPTQLRKGKSDWLEAELGLDQLIAIYPAWEHVVPHYAAGFS